MTYIDIPLILWVVNFSLIFNAQLFMVPVIEKSNDCFANSCLMRHLYRSWFLVLCVWLFVLIEIFWKYRGRLFSYPHDSPPKFITISKHSPEALINFGNELESCDLIDKIDISLGGNPNDNYTKLQDILIKLKEKHLPNKTIKFNKQKHKKTPWITRSIIKSINLKNRLYKLLRVAPTNSLHYTTLKTNLQN